MQYLIICLPYIVGIIMIPFMKKHAESRVYTAYAIFILICYSVFLYMHVYC